MNQQGLLADKKCEGRCSDDSFFFTVCGKHFSGFIEALDSEGILGTNAVADKRTGTRTPSFAREK